MKRIVLFAFLLFCACSCKKETPQEMLMGTWEVSVKSVFKGNIGTTDAEKEYDEGIWYFTFDDGRGRYLKIDDEKTRTNFTYQYYNELGSILYETNNRSGEWFVDVLTKNTIVFHAESESSFGGIKLATTTTYSGKKLQ